MACLANQLTSGHSCDFIDKRGRAQHWAGLPDVKRDKVFCIGWHRTGTTSIGDALRMLGYNVGGWVGENGRLVRDWHSGDLTAIIQRARSFDALEDFPWPLVFREMDREFPGSKFVLTTRKSDAIWLRSAQRHLLINPWSGHHLIYGVKDPIGEADAHLARYRGHNDEVRTYFRCREDFLEMCFENGDGWKELCGFLGCARVPSARFPHSNRSQ